MNHITEDTLLAYLDGELESEQRARVAEHLLACEKCRQALDALRQRSRLLSEGLPPVERSPASAAWSELRTRAPRTREASTAAAPSDEDAVRSVRTFLQAAALVLAFAGAAAAAIPGSPVRGWLEHSVDAVAQLFTADAEEADRPEATGEALSAVAVKPEKGQIRIQLTQPAPGVVVRVELVEGERALVRARESRYRTAPGRIEVVQPRRGEVHVELPSLAREARVEVDGRPAVWLEGGRLVAEVDAEQDSPSVVVFRIPPAQP